MSIPYEIIKKMKKTIKINGYDVELVVEYTTEDRKPYNIKMVNKELGISYRDWTTKLEEVPLILVNLKKQVEKQLKSEDTYKHNAEKLKEIFDNF